MPEPSTIVTFVDNDRDEFPVLLAGHRSADSTTLRLAMWKAEQAIGAGGFTPNGPLRFERIEQVGGAA